jgi:branched-chain amino acid aminotransferase
MKVSSFTFSAFVTAAVTGGVSAFVVQPTPTSTGSIGTSFGRRSTTPLFVAQSEVSKTEETSLNGESTAVKGPTTSADLGIQPGTADMGVPWEELGFEFRTTKSHVRMTYKDNEGWGPIELEEDPYLKIHMGATALHYGQACFEGMKAFMHADNTVHVFRPDENSKRITNSAERIMMPKMSEAQFLEAVTAAVRDNIAYVPPYGSNGALYLRPLLFGSGPRIGLQPSDEYTFLIMVIPVGDYYKGGLSSKVKCFVSEDYDRAAPRGVGHAKVAGNYAADLLPNFIHKEAGYPITLYPDAKTKTLVEEFSTSNFIGLNAKEKTYVTPSSPSVLPSITNLSLQTIARDVLGYEVEKRDVRLDELSSFDEVVACGTAVVVTPIGSIKHGDQEHTYGEGDSKDEVGEITMQLYNQVRAVQNGEAEDKYGWNYKVFG